MLLSDIVRTRVLVPACVCRGTCACVPLCVRASALVTK